MLPFLWLPFHPTHLLIFLFYCMHSLHVCVYMLACIRVDTHMPRPTPVHQETVLGSRFSPAMWVPRIKFRLSGVRADTMTCLMSHLVSQNLGLLLVGYPTHPTPKPSAASSSFFLWLCGEQWTDRASACFVCCYFNRISGADYLKKTHLFGLKSWKIKARD